MSGSRTKNLFKIILVAGARPNFMKVAPIIKEMEKFPEIEPILVHTGQHYDKNMSHLFFEELGIPEPYINLEVGSASHAIQTAEIMRKFEEVVLKEKPDLVVVVGDVNSTLACALVSAKLGIKIAHVEAGLRSFDRTMPEEINRLLTDAISDLLFTTEESANENLRKEGVSEDKIFFVGNVMIDTLLAFKRSANSSRALERLGLRNLNTNYSLLTLHRPSNVDDKNVFQDILSALDEISDSLPVLFPCHPRTRKKIEDFGFMRFFNNGDCGKGIYLMEPLSYLDFLSLMMNAKLVFTDSGGIQEETTILGIPCLTIRENTERPITVCEGTNVVVGNNKERIIKESFKAINNEPGSKRIPSLWDGKSAQRVVRILLDQLGQWIREPKKEEEGSNLVR